MALEEAFQITVDEGAFTAAATVADLEAMTRPPDWGQTGVRPGSDPGGAGDRGQTPEGRRPGSDPSR